MSLLHRIANLFTREKLSRAIDDELKAHIDMRIADNIDAGMTPHEARRDALLRFGNVVTFKEEVTGADAALSLDGFVRDVQYTFRTLNKSRVFAATVILTLALGVGADTAIFSVVNSTLLRPLPYKDSNRLVWITEKFALRFSPGAVFGPDYLNWRRANTSFDDIEAFQVGGPDTSVEVKGQPLPAQVTAVTPHLLSMLGVTPFLGRSFTESESNEGQNRVVLLGDAFWRSRFDADPHVLGSVIHLDGIPYTVIGVLPRSVRYPDGDLWTPIALDSPMFSPAGRPMAIVNVIGKLKDGVTASGAEANLEVASHRIDNQYPAQFLNSRDRHVQIVELNAFLVRNVRPLLLVLLGVVAFVLLIACANVTHLLLSRATVRTREFAVRAALGAAPGRLLRQSLTESLVLAVLGSCLGFLGGLWFVGLIKQLIPPAISSTIHLDPRMLVFALGIAMFTTLLCGLVPAFLASRTTVSDVLKSGDARSGSGKGSRLLRSALVSFEVGLSLILLIGAGLLTQTFRRLNNVELGFDPHNILTAKVSRPMPSSFNATSQVPFFNQVLDRFHGLPGITYAAASTIAPLSSCADNGTTSVDLRGQTEGQPLQSVCQDSISGEYFHAMGIPLLGGRFFTEEDTNAAPAVAIVNRTFAHIAFSGQDPIGRSIGLPGLDGVSRAKIVGVVADVKNNTLEESTWPEVFIPYTQGIPPISVTFVVRSHGDPSSLAGEIREAIQAVDQYQAAASIQTMPEVIAEATATQQLRMVLLDTFAILAFVLAIIGVFGVMNYSVRQRTQEIAVRMAVGAQRVDVISLIVRQGISIAGLGLFVGIVGALGCTSFLSSFLYGVKPTDLLTFLGASLLLIGTAAIASYIPARRAASINPVQALRIE